jgi:hypothetical protein
MNQQPPYRLGFPQNASGRGHPLPETSLKLPSVQMTMGFLPPDEPLPDPLPERSLQGGEVDVLDLRLASHAVNEPARSLLNVIAVNQPAM